MRRPARPLFGALLAVTVLAIAGCATVQRGFTAIDQGIAYVSKGLSFASWEHLAFSLMSPPFATRKDVETARRQGGWWGDPVPVAENE